MNPSSVRSAVADNFRRLTKPLIEAKEQLKDSSARSRLETDGIFVDTVVSDVKTEYSRAGMPLDPARAEVLLNWQRMTEFTYGSMFYLTS
jgi:hypothetical protein